jgi:hypothetical protein
MTAGSFNQTTSTNMGKNIYKYNHDETAGNVSRMTGPGTGKKFPGNTMWYQDKLINMN